MRYRAHPLISTPAGLLLSVGALVALGAGSAVAAPPTLFPASALTLTVAEGERATNSVPLRAVTLNCRPAPGGTHPVPAEACAALDEADGDIDALTGAGGTGCPKKYDPVVVTIEGVWEGERVADERTFSNHCTRRAEGGTVFAF